MHGHNYKYECEQILLSFFPDRRPEYSVGTPSGERCEISLKRETDKASAVCRLYTERGYFFGRAFASQNKAGGPAEKERLLRRIVKLAFYRAALRATGETPVWGSITGIRPAKLMEPLLDSGLSDRAAMSLFCRRFDVSPERARLCLSAAKKGISVRSTLGARDVCLYIGIPFCPTRCDYCSFVSRTTEKDAFLIQPFCDVLKREADALAKITSSLGFKIISVYIGGGTPTSLPCDLLDSLCSHLESVFDFSGLREYTLEAGRPDTISPEKLSILKKRNITRISVNPQTMRSDVLFAIGRRHTPEDVARAVFAARDIGGFTINTDLIAGLPTDTVSGFSDTVDLVLALEPENITVHTLCLKKGSRISLEKTKLPSAEDTGEMLRLAAEKLTIREYRPYYLYRQKFMSGGFENVGWSKNGCENLYNVCIMDELTTILALGAGASAKLVSKSGRIERVFSPKYPLEYINGAEKIISNKKRIEEFDYGILS